MAESLPRLQAGGSGAAGTEISSRRGMDPQVITLPPDADIQPISEGLFRAFVRDLPARETPAGTVYGRDDQPWMLMRRGDRLVVRHRSDPAREMHYLIV